MRKSVLVSGPVLSCSGYGEQSRFALRSLRSREDIFDIYVNPLTWGKTSWITEDNEERAWIEKANMMDKIIVPSTHSKNTFTSTTYQLFNQQTQEHVGDLQTSTEFEVMPFPLRTTNPEPLDIDFSTKFNFLTVAQISPRKNLETLLRNFVREFREEEEVGLVMKVSVANNSIYDKYNTASNIMKLLNHPEMVNRKCKVYLLHGDLSEGQLATLYRHPQT